MNHRLAGIYAAAITPLNQDYSFDSEGLIYFLEFLAKRGCHGALMLGTTGEGPSFAPEERRKILKEARKIRQQYPEFRLLAGTGTPSLDETIELTKDAFDLEYDGVVVLPPFYFRNATDEGLFEWFKVVIEKAVPSGGSLFGYHIPNVSGVPLSISLVDRLNKAFPGRFAGVKDSSASKEHAQNLGEGFGRELLILNGTDRLLSFALESGASGSITALANLISPDLRRVWDNFKRGKKDPVGQAKLTNSRKVLEKHLPAAPFLKALLARLHNFPNWSVKPPLCSMNPEAVDRAILDWRTRGKIATATDDSVHQL